MAAKKGLSLINFWLSCTLLTACPIICTATEFTEEMVTEWAENIGKEVYQFSKNITHVEDLQKSYEALNLTSSQVDWMQLLQSTKVNIERYFDKKIKSLKNIANNAESAYCRHVIDNSIKKVDIKFPDAKELDSFLNKSKIALEYNPSFLQDVTFNTSVIHVPTDVYKGSSTIVNGIKWSDSIDGEFIKNAKDDPSLVWQYFASTEGFMRIYPGHKWPLDQVDLYDARSRSWFIQGATSPKDMVIVLDASGSMRGVPMSLAKLSAKALIDTFEDNDYFNVIWFNKEAGVLVCSENLTQATKKNKQAAKKIIDDSEKLQGENMANWRKGIGKAFQLLEDSRKTRNTSSCQQAILIFSDGTTNNLKEFYETVNPNRMVRVFTYPVGPPAERTRAMLHMSRQNRGYFSRIQSVGAVRSVSESYIRVLSRPMARAPKENVSNSAGWTGAYLDAMGLGMMVTVTLPVFYRPNVVKNCSTKSQKEKFNHLIGVVGTDIPLKNLHELFFQPLIGDNGYYFVVNNNGLVAFHPRLKTVYGYLPDAPGVDLIDAEFPLNKDDLTKLRNHLISQTFTSKSKPIDDSFEVYDVSQDELRVVKRKAHFYVDSLHNTPFSFAIATPSLGFRYKLKSDALLGEITKELDSEYLSLEKWDYCKGIFSSENPVKQLKTKDFSTRPSDCNEDMLNGLAVDLKATSNIPNVWTFDESLKSVFVRTHYGVTRKKSCTSCSGDSGVYNLNQRDIGRVDDALPQSVVYLSPYDSGRREKNTSSVVALKKVVFNNITVAVTGYELQSSSFDKLVVDNTKKCKSNKCADVNCDRAGKNSHEGLYCYLLDENGFVVSSNTDKSSGMFFGKVDNTIMKELIQQNDNSTSGFYHRVVFIDYQAVCEKKTGFSSAGTSLLAPLFSVSSYVDWWTNKAMWFLAYFNVYSWMMSETKSFTVASEDKPKNYSCIKEVTTYYADSGNILQNGSAYCQTDNCMRDFIVKSVPHSNMFLVVVDAKCGVCSDTAGSSYIPGEPKVVDITVKCQPALFRKRPRRCFVSDDSEAEYPPGAGSRVGPSLLLMILMITASLLMKSSP